MRDYFVKVTIFGPGIFKRKAWRNDGVLGTNVIRARSRDAAAKRMLNEFFERFPQALENRLTVGVDVQLI